MTQNTDIEFNVAGSLLVFPDLWHDLELDLQPEWFTDIRCSHLIRTIRDMQEKGQVLDTMLIAHSLQSQGIKDCDALWIAEMMQRSSGTAHLKEQTNLLRSLWMERQLNAIGRELSADLPADAPDISERIQQLQDRLYLLTEQNMQREATQLAPDVDAAVERIRHASETGQPLTGLPTGFRRMDELLLGLQASDLIIIAARPSQGKTALAVSLMRQMAAHAPVAFFSLEMGREQIVNRLLMQVTGIAGEKIRMGVLSPDEQAVLHRCADRVRTMPVYIDDTPSLPVAQLRQKARKLVRRNKVGVIIVDYLQLMSASLGKSATRENEVSAISRALKCLAKELKVPVVALAQLNREPERASEVREPRLSDLRESGAIEQDADVVIMLHKPKTALGGERELIIAKHRNGATGHLLLQWDAPTANFSERARARLE